MTFTFYISHSNFYAQKSQHIRVAIIDDASSLSLKIKGLYEIRDSLGQKVLYRGKYLKTAVTAYKYGILIAGKDFRNNRLSIKAVDPEAILIDGRAFRGDILFIKKDNLRLLVVNQIDLEDYIKGILYHEASHYWPLEALKAQAVTSRTYAKYQIQLSSKKDYDVTSDIYSQVYGGRTSERYRTNLAVDETREKVLVYQGKIFPTYFHATCSGHTEDASLLWNIGLPVLKGVPCNFCKDSPHYKWHSVLSQDEVIAKLLPAGYKIKNIKEVTIVDKDKSGRISNLKIISDNKEVKISAKDFRNIIGPNVIRSTKFTVRVINHDIVFEGFGWGHGVGLCQWGAYFMAKQDYRYNEILKYYYPGAEISIK